MLGGGILIPRCRIVRVSELVVGELQSENLLVPAGRVGSCPNPVPQTSGFSHVGGFNLRLCRGLSAGLSFSKGLGVSHFQVFPGRWHSRAFVYRGIRVRGTG